MADILSNEAPATPQNFLAERLDKERSFPMDGSPSFDEFKALSVLCNKNDLEYGMQFNLMSDRSVKTVFNTGQKRNISTPDGYHEAWKVFFHTHPKVDVRSDKSVIAMTPSYMNDRHDQFYVGDIDGSVWNMNDGKYLNIINSVGVSFMIGKEKHTKTAKLTNEMRKKFKVEDETSKPILFIKSGKNDGEVIDRWTPETQMTDHLGDDDHLLFTLRVPYEDEDYNMLFVTHDKLKELGITPEEICFKSGVNKLVDVLSVNIPHSNNLVNAMHSHRQDASI